MFYSLFPQSLSKFSLVYLLAWYPPLHTPYISSPNHCLLFAAHDHTIATCFAVVLRLCHLILVFLSTLYSDRTLSCNFTPHIHLTILIMHRGLLQSKRVSSQCLLEMSIVHVLSQIWWQCVPHMKTGSRETSVTKAVEFAWNDTYPLRWGRLALTVSRICQCYDWFTEHVSLNSTLWHTSATPSLSDQPVTCLLTTEIASESALYRKRSKDGLWQLKTRHA